jgi:hypothetical protein
MDTIICELPDVVRLRCRACDEIWAALEEEICRCGSSDVATESLNEILRSLAQAEERVDQLLYGIREHVQYLRTEHGRLVRQPQRV